MDYGRNATVHLYINTLLLGGNFDIVADDGLSTGIYCLSDLEYGGITLFRNVDKYSRAHTVYHLSQKTGLSIYTFSCSRRKCPVLS